MSPCRSRRTLRRRTSATVDHAEHKIAEGGVSSVLSATPRLRAVTGHEWWDGEYEDLQVRAHEASGRRVAVVTLDLPERRNSMSGPMTASWVEVMRLLRADGDLAAVVVTGAAPAFCAGGDLTWLVSDPDASVPDLRTRMLAFYRSWL